ncbi:lytic transglycosylase domain-containing protein [Actinokineospora soli]|uniref:Lytic transglycosylase domain-containing protein n=1 Tax=Actinokineospora soli TaxID=1048753 RepID=A0ABW2TH16_9PSEU
MSAKKGGQHRKRSDRGRRRSAVAAAGAMLLVPAVVAGEPAPWLAPADDVALAGHPGAGATELDDPSTLGADGSKPENAKIGPQILALADKPDLLALTAGPTAGYPRGPLGIPGNMLTAYMRAAQSLAATMPNCKLQWSLLASIGRIESGHAYGGQADANGNTVRRILGPELNGAGPVAAIADTDGGRYDGNTVWDHAVGPMQFIPSTWAGYASDGNGDGQTDPNNIFDAAVGAGKYLCSGGLDLSDGQQRAVAVFRYNNSDSYVRTVLLWADAYARGVHPMDPTPVRDIPQPVIIPPSNGEEGEIPPGVTPTQPPSTPPSATTTRPRARRRPPRPPPAPRRPPRRPPHRRQRRPRPPPRRPPPRRATPPPPRRPRPPPPPPPTTRARRKPRRRRPRRPRAAPPRSTPARSPRPRRPARCNPDPPRRPPGIHPEGLRVSNDVIIRNRVPDDHTIWPAPGGQGSG